MPTPQQNWFAGRKWGVFTHYLEALQNGSGNYHNTQNLPTSWDECVRELDVEKLARELHEINAGYLIFTLQQGSRFLCAPNRTFEEATGYAPGEACSTRDLVAELADALAPYGIPLFLYFTGDGPVQDSRAMAAFYGSVPNLERDRVTPEFAHRWAGVMREYSLRYGERVRGWWVDGLYPSLGYTEPLIALYKEAALAGNPNALFSANYYGCLKNAHNISVPGLGNLLTGDFYHTIQPPTASCDFTAGEVVTLDVFNTAQLVGDAQAHILSFLGIPTHPIEVYGGWGARGCKYSPDYLLQYTQELNRRRGVLSLDVCLYRDGHIDPEQRRVLRMLGALRT